MALRDLIANWNSGPVRVSGDTVTADGANGPVTMRVFERSADEAELQATWQAPAWFSGTSFVNLRDIATGIAFGRSGLLRCTERSGTVEIVMTVYTEGLNRQGFASAAGEVARALDALTAFAQQLESQRDAMQGAERDIASAREQARTATTTRATAAQPVAQAWRATHVVPATGMQAWAQPDPSQQPIAALQPGVELQVTESRGAWARVVGSNGWTGWVDGRALVARG